MRVVHIPTGLAAASEAEMFELLDPQAIADGYGFLTLRVRLKKDMNLGTFWKVLMDIRDQVELHGAISSIERITRERTIRRGKGRQGLFDFKIALSEGEELKVNAVASGRSAISTFIPKASARRAVA